MKNSDFAFPKQPICPYQITTWNLNNSISTHYGIQINLFSYCLESNAIFLGTVIKSKSFSP